MNIELHMDQMLPLDPMGPIGTGHQRLELTMMIKESPEPLPVKRSTAKVDVQIVSLARPSLLCGTKDRPAIRPVVPTRRSRMAKTLQEINMLSAWAFTDPDVILCELHWQFPTEGMMLIVTLKTLNHVNSIARKDFRRILGILLSMSIVASLLPLLFCD
jgi:hypothetical protein